MTPFQLPVNEILAFWFGDSLECEKALKVQSRQWFMGGEILDEQIRQRFAQYFDDADSLDPEEIDNPQLALAWIILLDQFSRNCFRGKAEAYAYDTKAIKIMDVVLAKDWQSEMHPLQQAFLLMPLQHAETMARQEQGVRCFEALAAAFDPEQPFFALLKGNADYAREHREIVAQFGRFPHRNGVLGRTSTAEERAYLDNGGKRFGQ